MTGRIFQFIRKRKKKFNPQFYVWLIIRCCAYNLQTKSIVPRQITSKQFLEIKKFVGFLSQSTYTRKGIVDIVFSRIITKKRTFKYWVELSKLPRQEIVVSVLLFLVGNNKFQQRSPSAEGYYLRTFPDETNVSSGYDGFPFLLMF